jgi:hypothetical protein
MPPEASLAPGSGVFLKIVGQAPRNKVVDKTVAACAGRALVEVVEIDEAWSPSGPRPQGIWRGCDFTVA